MTSFVESFNNLPEGGTKVSGAPPAASRLFGEHPSQLFSLRLSDNFRHDLQQTHQLGFHDLAQSEMIAIIG
jgi:hypothetical protein